MLEFRQVSKYYPKGLLDRSPFKALEDVSFRVPAGEITGLTGQSGSGKTSLARIALRLAAPSSGTVLLDRENIFKMPERAFRKQKEGIQMMFQHPETAFNPLMTLKSSILEGYAAAGIPAGTREARLEGDFSRFGLSTGLLKRYPAQVSGGEIQRAVFMRVLAFEPRVLVMDEPTSMLDLSVQARVLSMVRQISRETGMAVLLISHDPGVLKAMCRRVVTMDQGRVSCIARP